eukprot:Opistho-2@69822
MSLRFASSLARPYARAILATTVRNGGVLPRVAGSGHRAALVTPASLQVAEYHAGRRHKKPINTIINFVPQQEAWVIERFGKFHRVLEPGVNILLPIIDDIKYVHSLKELALDIPSQSAITQDNVTLHLDGVLYLKVEDPKQASYGVEDPEYAVKQLAQTTMRSEIGKMRLDDVFRERASLNLHIVDAINSAAAVWGIRCLRYEIRDIQLPDKVVESMQTQVAAERKKRAAILESEGARESAVNIAEGNKTAQILASEARKEEQVNIANGEAQAIIARAEATAQSIERIAKAIASNGGKDAVSMTVAEQYVEAFSKLAKTGTTILLPAHTNDAGSMVAQAMSIFDTVRRQSPHAEGKVADAVGKIADKSH